MHPARPRQHRQDEAWEQLTDLSSSHSALLWGGRQALLATIILR